MDGAVRGPAFGYFDPSAFGGQIVNAGGNIAGSIINADAQGKANEQNIAAAKEAMLSGQEFAREQMRFQERMSNTAYQRSMQDMRDAGLNPMLAFSQGGANTPSGASGSAMAGRAESTGGGDAVKGDVTSALILKTMEKDLEKKDSEIAANAAVVAAKNSETHLNETTAKQVKANTDLTNARLPAVRAQSKYEKGQAEIDEKMLYPDNTVRRVGEGVGIVGKALDAVNPLRWLRGGSTPPPSNHPPRSSAGKGYHEQRETLRKWRNNE